VDVELGCRYPRTCVLGNVQPSLRDWSCSEPLPSTACWAKFSRPFGTGSNIPLACRLSPTGYPEQQFERTNLDKTVFKPNEERQRR
jgi:hypothetical protein